MKCLVALVGALLLVGSMSGCSGCMDQYRPERYREQTQKEREIAHRQLPKLTEKGELPAPAATEAAPGATGADGAQATAAAPAADVNPGKAKFDSLCASCHGPEGKADGPAVQAMNPKPRNFHDKAWQAKVDDAHIIKVITQGGGAAGLSSMMPAMGAMLNDGEVAGIVKMIRDWGK